MNKETMQNGSLQIVVLDKGFVYVGNTHVADGWVKIENAKCIRQWGTTNGLGQLASQGPQPKTILDPTPTVRAPLASLVHLIACEESQWNSSI